MLFQKTMGAHNIDDVPIPGVDVILGRGEEAKRFNEHFRELVRVFAPAYHSSVTSTLKRTLATEIVRIVQNRGGRFLNFQCGKKDNVRIPQEMTQDAAIRKTMKALKDHKKRVSRTSIAKKGVLTTRGQKHSNFSVESIIDDTTDDDEPFPETSSALECFGQLLYPVDKDEIEMCITQV